MISTFQPTQILPPCGGDGRLVRWGWVGIFKPCLFYIALIAWWCDDWLNESKDNERCRKLSLISRLISGTLNFAYDNFTLRAIQCFGLDLWPTRLKRPDEGLCPQWPVQQFYDRSECLKHRVSLSLLLLSCTLLRMTQKVKVLPGT